MAHTSIGSRAFENCYKIIEVWNHSELPIALASSDYGSIAIFAKHVYTGEEKGCQTVTQDGYRFYEDGNENYLLAYYGNETELTLPQKSPNGKPYEIYQRAFYQCSNLTSVVIPDCVTIIGYGAFTGCGSLTSIEIPDSVTSIGSEAFSACISLTSIEIPEGVTSIENGTFYRCEGLTSITIPDSVKWIWAEAFLNCRSLTSVYYKGTPDKWSKILIHNSNSGFSDATRYYFPEEAPDEAKWQESENWWHYDADGEIVIWKKSDAVS